jgi:ankyrin repeat protein
VNLFLEAVAAGNMGALRVLVDAGCNINATSLESNMTALHFAARKQDYKAMAELIELGASWAVLDANGRCVSLSLCSRATLFLLFCQAEAVVVVVVVGLCCGWVRL